MVSFTTDSVNSKHYECSGTLDTDTWEYYLSCGDRKTEHRHSELLEVEGNMTSLIHRKGMQEDIKKDRWVNGRMGGLTIYADEKKMLCVPIFQVTVEDCSLPGSPLLL